MSEDPDIIDRRRKFHHIATCQRNNVRVLIPAEEVWKSRKTREKYGASKTDKIKCQISDICGGKILVVPQVDPAKQPYGKRIGFERVFDLLWQQRTVGQADPPPVVNSPAAYRHVRLRIPTVDKYSGLPPAKRRHHIQNAYETLYMSAPESEWQGRDGVIQGIRSITGYSAKQVKNTLHRILEEGADGDDVDVRKRKRGGGAKRKMREADLRLALDILRGGAGSTAACAAVNCLRHRHGLGPVCTKTVTRTAKAAGGRPVEPKKKASAAKRGIDSAWARARLALAQQILQELVDGRLCLEQILFVDEKHIKTVLGTDLKHWVVPEDPQRPHHYLPKEEGGVEPDRPAQYQVKYPGEVRYCCGVMMKVDADGTLVGCKMEPFQYTSNNIVSPKTYNERKAAEIARVKQLVTYKKNKGAWACNHADDPYAERYGKNAEKVMQSVLKSRHKTVGVVEMMDHVIAQGNELFADTPYANSWVIWHDALGSWWTAQAQVRRNGDGSMIFTHTRVMQKHLHDEHNMRDRQIRLLDPDAPARYIGKLPGDSPELMPLDNNLFADLMYSLRLNCALTRHLLPGDDRKFHFGTEKECAKAFMRTWEHSPTSERIVQDISRIRMSLEAIVNAQGGYVDYDGARHGRRAEGVYEVGARSQRTPTPSYDLDDLNIFPGVRLVLEEMVNKYDTEPAPVSV